MGVVFKQMQAQDVVSAVELIAAAMNQQESLWAQDTFEHYFQCKKHGIDSARDYFTAWYGSELCGLVGLHHYRWGPEPNVWLSWFAVKPDYQGKGIGSQLINYVENVARESGFKQLLIETYSSEEFAQARKFYQKNGYVQIGTIKHYISGIISMLIYCKKL